MEDKRQKWKDLKPVLTSRALTAKVAMFSTQVSNEALKAVQVRSYETDLQSEIFPSRARRVAEKAYISTFYISKHITVQMRL